MGGANVLMTPEELAELPMNLAHSDFFYWATFNVDCGLAVEYEFVKRLLFNLTKQLVKSKTPISDPEFREWRLQMASQDHLVNWTQCVPNQPFSANDEHVQELTTAQFMCYGYVERKFKDIFIHEMTVLFPALSEWLKSEKQKTYSLPKQSDQFKDLIEQTLQSMK
jgi:hypothetical protein